MVTEIIFSLTLENVSRMVQDLHQYWSHNFGMMTTVSTVFHLFYRQMIECDRADGSWRIWKQHKKIILVVIWLDTFTPKSLSQCPNQGSCWYTFHPVGFAVTLQTKVFNATPSRRLLLAVLDTDWCVSDISVWFKPVGILLLFEWMNNDPLLYLQAACLSHHIWKYLETVGISMSFFQLTLYHAVGPYFYSSFHVLSWLIFPFSSFQAWL